MKFTIEHVMEYRYSETVRLDPHVLRLTPRPGPELEVLAHSIEVAPSPQGSSALLDASGNSVTSVWFDGTTDFLRVTSRCTVETRRPNPYDFLLTSRNRILPPVLDANERPSILQCLAPGTATGEVESFARGMADHAGGQTLEFLNGLNEAICTGFEQEVREEGGPMDPGECLRRRAGACRDLTVLFMAACRAVGIPARFVSGYSEGDLDMLHRHLHAWPEVYLPGAGWRGYDPTLGVAVADRHVPLAASAEAAGAAPVTGTFWSYAAKSQLDYSLDLTAV